MKKEGKSVADLRDLFQEVSPASRAFRQRTAVLFLGPVSPPTDFNMMQYATKLYGNTEAAEDGDSDVEGADIEAEIKKELSDIRKPTANPLFQSVKLDTQCRKPREDVCCSTLANLNSALLQDTCTG